VGVDAGNGWQRQKNGGAWGSDWFGRAQAGVIYIMVNDHREAIYFIRGTDAKGALLDGRNTYTMTFAKDALPPMDRTRGGFWSLTMYDKDYFMLPNSPNGRTNVGTVSLDANELKFAADGSLTITMSHVQPNDAVARANWLPTPEGQFALIVRAYVPTEQVQEGSYKLPNVERVPTGVGSRAIGPSFAESVQMQDTTSALVRDLYDGKWPDKNTVAQLNRERFYQRGIEAYMMTLPALNIIGMRDGSEAKFGKGYNVLPIWKDRMNGKTLVPTPNCDVIYAMSYLDLKETGPLVVYAPPGVIGMFTDFYQRTLTDVGALGPDHGQGGLYLLLPPGYRGPVPGGYHAYQSATYSAFLFFRTVLTQGADGPDTHAAVATAEQTRVYPLGTVERERKKMEFPNASNVAVNMMYPADFSYWEKLKAFVDYEPVEALAPEVRGALASIGIIKDVPFNPDAAAREALTRAVNEAPKMIYAQRIAGRPDERDHYYSDRQYLSIWSGLTANWDAPTYLDTDARAQYFQFAYSSAPAMANDTINQGSKYPFAMRDKDGSLLDGSNTYKLHLPAGIPAKLYWAVTIYNPVDGTMPQTGQPFPSRNQFDKPPSNPDGSLDMYFGPTKPDGVDPKSWIQTQEGKAFLVAIRLYGSGTEFYDQTWKPDDVVRLGVGGRALQ
jgi:hypothetical protein